MSTTTTTALKDILAYSSASEALERPAGNADEAEPGDARAAALDQARDLSPQEVDGLLESSETGRYLLDRRGLLPVPDLDRELDDTQSIRLADVEDDALGAARGVMVGLICTALLWGLIFVIALAL